MPSRTIQPTQVPEAAPFSYTVGTADGITPEAVFVSWDGSGAAGDFLPCVSYYDNDGNLLDRAFPDLGPVTAGDTAEVSYRPFKRGGGGGGGATKAVYALGRFHGIVNPPTANAPILTFDVQGITPILGGQWVIDTAGIYLATIMGYAGLQGGSIAGTEVALTLYNFTHPPEIVRMGVITPDAIPAGQELDVDGSATMLCRLAAGDTLGMQLQVGGPLGTHGVTYDGQVALWKML